LVVEMMAELVDERAQERLERDDVAPRRRAHPDRDLRALALVFGLVESVELAGLVGRALRENGNADPRHAVPRDEYVDKTLARNLDRCAIVARERVADARDPRARLDFHRKVEPLDRIALAVDALACGG